MEVFAIGRYWKCYVNKSLEGFIKCMKYVNQKIKLDSIDISEEDKVLSEIKEGIIKIDSKIFLDEENWCPHFFFDDAMFFGDFGKKHSIDFK